MHILGFLPVAAAIALLSFWKVGDPDAFWHLKTGELILEWICRGGMVLRECAWEPA